MGELIVVEVVDLADGGIGSLVPEVLVSATLVSLWVSQAAG